MPSDRGKHAGNNGAWGANGKCRVRWTLDEKICARWRDFCTENKLPVQAEVEHALSWWMELPASMRRRLKCSGES